MPLFPASVNLFLFFSCSSELPSERSFLMMNANYVGHRHSSSWSPVANIPARLTSVVFPLQPFVQDSLFRLPFLRRVRCLSFAFCFLSRSWYRFVDLYFLCIHANIRWLQGYLSLISKSLTLEQFLPDQSNFLSVFAKLFFPTGSLVHWFCWKVRRNSGWFPAVPNSCIKSIHFPFPKSVFGFFFLRTVRCLIYT